MASHLQLSLTGVMELNSLLLIHILYNNIEIATIVQLFLFYAQYSNYNYRRTATTVQDGESRCISYLDGHYHSGYRRQIVE
jgi:hypothetical protein